MRADMTTFIPTYLPTYLPTYNLYLPAADTHAGARLRGCICCAVARVQMLRGCAGARLQMLRGCAVARVQMLRGCAGADVARLRGCKGCAPAFDLRFFDLRGLFATLLLPGPVRMCWSATFTGGAWVGAHVLLCCFYRRYLGRCACAALLLLPAVPGPVRMCCSAASTGGTWVGRPPPHVVRTAFLVGW